MHEINKRCTYVLLPSRTVFFVNYVVTFEFYSKYAIDQLKCILKDLIIEPTHQCVFKNCKRMN